MKRFGKKNKTIVSFIATLLSVVLLLSGTFAWMQVASRANEWLHEEENGNPGGTGHDDFCQPNKDIYVENWGDTDIFVRIRLDEYMETGEGAGKYIGSNLTTQAQDPDNHASSLINGALIYNRATWEPHIPHNGNVTVCETDSDFHSYWKWTMGGQKWYMPSLSHLNGYVSSDPTPYTAADAVLGAKQTLPGFVITMERWHDIGKPVGQNYWVVDEDGWAYWAQPLRAGTATGLLLDAVNLLKPVNDSYYYAINVLYQMASRTNDDGSGDYNDFGKGGDKDHTWTDDGHDLMDTITGKGGGGGGTGSWGEDRGVTISPLAPFADAKVGHRIFIPQGSTVTLKATVTESAAGTGVTWVEQPTKPGFTFTDASLADDLVDVTIAANAAVGSTYPVRAEATADTSYYSKKTIVVIPAGTKIVDGGGGRVFIDFGDNTFQEILNSGAVGNLFCGGEDKIPGNADDRNDVYIANGVKYLPSRIGDLGGKGAHGGQAGWYWVKDGDGKLGTADDVEVDLGGTQTQAPATITGIALTPINVTLAQGALQQFTVTATMSDNTTRSIPASQVTWEISPNPSSATTLLTGGGLLTVGADETQTTLYVYATLNANTALSGSATVTVATKPTLPNLKDLAVGDIVKMDGIDMIKLYDTGTSIVYPNFALFMTAENFQARGVFNADGSKLNYSTSTMKNAIDTWFAALPANGDIRSRISPPTNVFESTSREINSFSNPTPNTYGHTNQVAGMAFAPNNWELREFTNQWYRAQGQTLQASDFPLIYKNVVPGDNFWLRTYWGVGANANLAFRFSTVYGSDGQYINYPDVAGYRACVWLYVGS
jgi:hypothetical protein